jgi:hypothetical protein
MKLVAPAFLVGLLFFFCACSSSTTSGSGDASSPSDATASDASQADSGAEDASDCGPVNPGRCICGEKYCSNGQWTCPPCPADAGSD